MLPLATTKSSHSDLEKRTLAKLPSQVDLPSEASPGTGRPTFMALPDQDAAAVVGELIGAGNRSSLVRDGSSRAEFRMNVSSDAT